MESLKNIAGQGKRDIIVKSRFPKTTNLGNQKEIIKNVFASSIGYKKT